MSRRASRIADMITDNRGFNDFRSDYAPAIRAQHTLLVVCEVWGPQMQCEGRKPPPSGTCPIALRVRRRATQGGSPPLRIRDNFIRSPRGENPELNARITEYLIWTILNHARGASRCRPPC